VVTGRVPVLGERHGQAAQAEELHHPVDPLDDGVPFLDGQGASGHEVVLHVNDRQGIPCGEPHRPFELEVPEIHDSSSLL
jgi:hypothetical protein